MGGTDELKKAYDKAISASTRTGFLQDAALASYLAGIHYKYHEGDVDTSNFYIRKARETFKSWGAEAVVKHIETSFPELFMDSLSISKSKKSVGYRSRKRFDESLQSKHRELPSKMLSENSNTSLSSSTSSISWVSDSNLSSSISA